MLVRYCDHHRVTLPQGHVFPMEKYASLRHALVAEGVLTEEELAPADPAPREALEAVHAPEYVAAVLAGTLSESAVRRLGFPWSAALVARSLASVGGTLQAARAALDHGIAGNLAGGTHHAHRDFGAGYCVFNDAVVAARALLDAERVDRVLVLDVDVHQGDGTAALCADEPRVFTASIHGARNFPARKAASDLDVALPDGTGDDAYLAALAPFLDEALGRSRPELVLYQGGVDPLASDRFGRLALTLDGLAERDRCALSTLRAAGAPVALMLGGGYARPIEDSVTAHVNTYRAAREALS